MELVFGVSTVRLLHAEVEAKGLTRALVVTTQSLVDSPILKSVVVVKMGPIVAIDYSRPVPVDQQ
jgi:alcohol dehydrogenase class IV